MNSSWNAVYESLPPTQPIDISQAATTPQRGGADYPSGDERTRAGGSSGGRGREDRSVTIDRS